MNTQPITKKAKVPSTAISNILLLITLFNNILYWSSFEFGIPIYSIHSKHTDITVFLISTAFLFSNPSIRKKTHSSL